MNAADKSLAAMRRQVREADDIVLVNKRCYAIFKHMQERAAELKRESEIDFTVDQLRQWTRVRILTPDTWSEENCDICRWCKRKLTAKNFSWDHVTPVARGGSFAQCNLELICSVSNGQKGNMREDEFGELLNLVSSSAFAPEAKADVLRRLGLGARWRS